MLEDSLELKSDCSDFWELGKEPLEAEVGQALRMLLQ